LKILFSTLKKVLFWSYERGSWQYDVMCVLILAFVFFAPNSVFDTHRPVADHAAGPMYVTGAEVDQAEAAGLDRRIRDLLIQKYGRQVSAFRVEADKDASGNVQGYFVWEKQ
jgi:hypothetical protein